MSSRRKQDRLNRERLVLQASLIRPALPIVQHHEATVSCPSSSSLDPLAGETEKKKKWTENVASHFLNEGDPSAVDLLSPGIVSATPFEQRVLVTANPSVSETPIVTQPLTLEAASDRSSFNVFLERQPWRTAHHYRYECRIKDFLVATDTQDKQDFILLAHLVDDTLHSHSQWTGMQVCSTATDPPQQTSNKSVVLLPISQSEKKAADAPPLNVQLQLQPGQLVVEVHVVTENSGKLLLTLLPLLFPLTGILSG